ncbi:MFS transporter [Ignatzschineria larvae DSM 13226]|uniref:MFS transporter n=1 Tax=Ignatzschineria larvae DSM 13226 TaxID=1111732 RepID=A0ABZ3C153_9GAMM|nr:MFS transporter [Ignatzschineria larvae]
MSTEILSEKENRSKRLLPVILAIAIFMQMLDTTILNTALPSIALSLNEPELKIQSILISYTLVLAICAPISGVVADKIGTRYTFLLAVIFFTLGSLLAALSMSLTQLTLSRILQGVGGAMLTPVARLALMKAYDRKDYLRVINYAITPALIGPILGPLLGGYLVQYASWHWIFLINLPIGLIVLILAAFFMPDFRGAPFHFDLRGYIIFALAIFLITFGLEYSIRGEIKWLAIPMILGGFFFLVWYWFYAKHKDKPLFSLTLLDVRTFRIGLNGNLVARLGISAMPFLLPLFFQVALGYSPSDAGWLLVPIAVGGLTVKPLVTKILYVLGYRRILIWNTVLISLFIITIGIFGRDMPMWALVIQLYILGLCNSTQFTAMNTLTVGDLGKEQMSSGNSLMVVNQQLALTLGVAFAALFLNFYIAQHWFPTENTEKAFQLTFITMGVLTLIATYIFAKLKKEDGDFLAGRSVK